MSPSKSDHELNQISLQLRPKTSSFPPRTAASTASANLRSACTSSLFWVDEAELGGLTSKEETPNALLIASSLLSPRSLSIERSRSRSRELSGPPKACRTAEEVAIWIICKKKLRASRIRWQEEEVSTNLLLHIGVLVESLDRHALKEQGMLILRAHKATWEMLTAGDPDFLWVVVVLGFDRYSRWALLDSRHLRW